MRKLAGYALADALIALIVITIGTLGLLQLQGQLMGNSIESRLRIQAAMMSNELISMASIDGADANCFTVPVANQLGCNNVLARSFTQAWEDEINAGFPGNGLAKATAVLDGTNQFTVTIQWQRTPQAATRNHVQVGQLGL